VKGSWVQHRHVASAVGVGSKVEQWAFFCEYAGCLVQQVVLNCSESPGRLVHGPVPRPYPFFSASTAEVLEGCW